MPPNNLSVLSQPALTPLYWVIANCGLAYTRQAEIIQSSLAVLAQRVDELKRGQDKLEIENKSLRDYIGDLILENVGEQTLIDTGIGQERNIIKRIGGSHHTIGQST
jgi:hypothetical protein